jgi:hypothetical protein
MPVTRIFKCGDSQAVRIAAELAYADLSGDLDIAAHGPNGGARLTTIAQQRIKLGTRIFST